MYKLPPETKLGDPCPYCVASNHTGVFDQNRRRWMVCMVCGDSGVIDQTSLDIYAVSSKWENL